MSEAGSVYMVLGGASILYTIALHLIYRRVVLVWFLVDLLLGTGLCVGAGLYIAQQSEAPSLFRTIIGVILAGRLPVVLWVGLLQYTNRRRRGSWALRTSSYRGGSRGNNGRLPENEEADQEVAALRETDAPESDPGSREAG